MPGELVTLSNLDDDHVANGTTDKIHFISALDGTGAPVDPPPVIEKVWFYVDKAEDPVALYAWDPVGEDWNPASAGVVGDGWALAGNAAGGTDVLGTTNDEPLRIVSDGVTVGILDADDADLPGGSIRLQPGGVGTLTGDAAQGGQLYLGTAHPDLGFGATLAAGDTADRENDIVKYVKLSPPQGDRGDVTIGVDADVARSDVAAKRLVSGATTFDLRAEADDGADVEGSYIVGSSVPETGLMIEAREKSGQIASGFLAETSGGAAAAQAITRVYDTQAVTPDQKSMILNLGGLYLEDFVDDVDGLAVGTLTGDNTNVLIAKHLGATANRPEGMYLVAAKLNLVAINSGGGAGLLQLRLDDNSGNSDEVLASLTLAQNVGGNWEIVI